MNALALPALGLAAKSAQALPALFADLAARSPSFDIVRLESTGHSENGRGAATYISDALCEAELLTAHPRFVFQTANSRIFRLLPDRASLSVEQGGAVGGGAVNDQPAIQAAIDYAHAVGVQEVCFEAEHYRVDCPLRTSPSQDTRAEDGHPLVVRKSLLLTGKAARRTVLDFRALDGNDPESDWQLVPISLSDPALSVWRGGGIFLQGDVADPGEAQRAIARLGLDRLVLRGNRQHSGAYVWPADPATGDGWDITDKALWVQDCYVGEIVCRDTDMVGWKGEIFYLGGAANAVERVELTRCKFATTNGSAINPSCDAEILAVDCSFGDCFQAQEDVSKTRAVYRGCSWHDCDHMALGSGATDGLLYNQAWPTGDDTAPPPMTLLENCEFRDINVVRFMSYVRGTIRAIDTSITLPGGTAMAMRDTDLGIESWLDRKNAIHALSFEGVTSLTEQVPGAPAGTFKLAPSNVRIRLAHHRTRLAQENNRQWIGSYWTGYIDRSCQIAVTGDCAGGRLPNGGDTPVSMPRVSYTAGEATTNYWPRGWYRPASLNGSGEVAIAAPFMTLGLESGIIADISLSRTPSGGIEYGYADGQTVRITKEGATGSLRFGKGASPSFAVCETRVLANAYDWIEFAYNRDWQRWEESGFFSDS